MWTWDSRSHRKTHFLLWYWLWRWRGRWLWRWRGLWRWLWRWRGRWRGLWRWRGRFPNRLWFCPSCWWCLWWWCLWWWWWRWRRCRWRCRCRGTNVFGDSYAVGIIVFCFLGVAKLTHSHGGIVFVDIVATVDRSTVRAKTTRLNVEFVYRMSKPTLLAMITFFTINDRVAHTSTLNSRCCRAIFPRRRGPIGGHTHLYHKRLNRRLFCDFRPFFLDNFLLLLLLHNLLYNLLLHNNRRLLHHFDPNFVGFSLLHLVFDQNW